MIGQSGPHWTDVAQVGLLAGQLLLLVVAAIVAGQQVREAKRLREEQSRPFVVIDFEVEGVLVFLSISNVGPSLARNVGFHIEPPMATAVDTQVADMKLLHEGISALAPGKVIRTFFDSGIQRKSANLPDSYRVVCRYTDQAGRRRFEEETTLDLGIYWGLSTIDRKGLHDIHQRLEQIRDVLKRWTTSSGALRRVSPTEERAEQENMRRLLEERRRGREGPEPAP